MVGERERGGSGTGEGHGERQGTRKAAGEVGKGMKDTDGMRRGRDKGRTGRGTEEGGGGRGKDWGMGRGGSRAMWGWFGTDGGRGNGRVRTKGLTGSWVDSLFPFLEAKQITTITAIPGQCDLVYPVHWYNNNK